MGEKSGIAWTDATFNPWWGCTKLSEACANCYAERDSKRFGGNYWGKDAPRRFFGKHHWDQVYDWDNKARKAGCLTRVFSGSMCDIFEDRPDLKEPRMQLWELIERTENLIWLLLTKRPENIINMIPFDWKWHAIPIHVWFGTTVENQHHVDRLIDIAALKTWTDNIFVSVEPMLGQVDFGEWWYVPKWVIVGGESGTGAREMKRGWIEHLKRICREKEIPFFLKQLGGFPDRRCDMSKWDADLRIQELPKEMIGG